MKVAAEVMVQMEARILLTSSLLKKVMTRSRMNRIKMAMRTDPNLQLRMCRSTKDRAHTNPVAAKAMLELIGIHNIV